MAYIAFQVMRHNQSYGLPNIPVDYLQCSYLPYRIPLSPAVIAVSFAKNLDFN